jgi:hypothetical protein
MTADTIFKLFEIVNRNFKSEADARAFVTEMDKLVSESTKEEARQLATKEDLVKEFSQSKIDLIKWMFGFWVTLVLLILANWFLKH